MKLMSAFPESDLSTVLVILVPVVGECFDIILEYFCTLPHFCFDNNLRLPVSASARVHVETWCLQSHNSNGSERAVVADPRAPFKRCRSDLVPHLVVHCFFCGNVFIFA